MNRHLIIAAAVLAVCLFGLMRWVNTHWSHWRPSRMGYCVWAGALMLGLLLVPVNNYLVPHGPLHYLSGILGVIMAGGALALMGLYLGWRLSLLFHSRRP